MELCELLDDDSEAGEVLLLADDSEGSTVPVTFKEAAAERNELEPGVDGSEIDEEELTTGEPDEDNVPLLGDFEDVVDVLVVELPAIVSNVLLPDESELMLVGEIFEVAEEEVELLEEVVEEVEVVVEDVVVI